LLMLLLLLLLQNDVGLIAINDACYLECTFYMLLRKHFHHLPYYTDLVDLFHEVTYSILKYLTGAI